MSNITEIKSILVTDLAIALAEIDMNLARLAAQRKEIANALVHAAGGVSGTFKAGETVFTVSENNTYPAAAMVAALKPGQIRLVQKKPALDPAKVKAMYPEVYNAAKVSNGHKVTVKS